MWPIGVFLKTIDCVWSLTFLLSLLFPPAVCDFGAHAGVDVQTQDIQPQPQRLPQDLPLPEMAEDGGTTRLADNTHGGTQTHTINSMCNFCYSLFAQLSHQDRLLTSGGSARCQAAAPSAEEEEQTTTTTTKRRVLARASHCPARCRWVQRCSLVLALFHYTLNRDVVTEQTSVLKVYGTLKPKVITWCNQPVRFLSKHTNLFNKMDFFNDASFIINDQQNFYIDSFSIFVN